MRSIRGALIIATIVGVALWGRTLAIFSHGSLTPNSSGSLEAAIQQKSFDLVSADAAANAVRSFNDLKRDTGVGKMTCAGQAGKSCTDNQNIRTVGHLYRAILPATLNKCSYV